MKQTQEKINVAPVGRSQSRERTAALTPVDFRQVKVGGEIGRRMDLTIHGNLLAIDVDRDFLPLFQVKTGRGNDTYVGLGKTMDGMVRLAANTGNAALLARKKHVIEELIKTQEPDGYIGFMRPESRTWELWDLHEQGYIITALVLDARLCGEVSSLAAARKLADYIIGRWPTKPAAWDNSLHVNEYLATIGLKRAFLLLSEAANDRKYLDFCVRQLEVKEWKQDIVLGRHGTIEGHSYSYCSHCLAQLELYRSDPDPLLLQPTMRAMDFMLAGDGMGITGGVGHDECWTDQQAGNGNFAETCSTAYQLFLYDGLLRLRGEARWGDLIERTLYNTAFAAQSPDGRQIRYYTPFEGRRSYYDRDTYCCGGNFRRMIATLPELIYYRSGNGVVVNLYTASQATLGEGADAVVVRQETDYPSSGLVTIMVDPARAMNFPLLLRIPGWCVQAAAKVNGKAVDGTAKAGEFLRIERTWQRGDKVTLDLPMPWRFIAGRKTQTGRAAIMRGPVVYSLSPGRITTSATGAAPAAPSLASEIDLKRLVLLPATIEPVLADATVRPGGTACRIKADLDQAGKGAYTLTLTEFPDPDGQATYFQLADPNAAVADELLAAAQ